MTKLTALVLAGALLASSCGFARRHPRLSAVTMVSLAAVIVVGGPLEHECTPEPGHACGAERAALIFGISAAVGALVGLWVGSKLTEPDDPPRRRNVVAGSGTVVRTVTVEQAPRWKACATAKVRLTERLESACRHGIVWHDALTSTCECAAPTAGTHRCTVNATAACRFEFDTRLSATAWSNVDSLAADRARTSVTAQCRQTGGRLRLLDQSCRCSEPDPGDVGWCGCTVTARCIARQPDFGVP